MEAYLAPTQPTQVNKITTSCEICSGPRDTQYCMEDPEQAFVEYASLHTDKAGVIIEYLVNICKRHAFWSLNEDILKINDFDNQYAVSIKGDTAYPCLHSPKTTKETRSIRFYFMMDDPNMTMEEYIKLEEEKAHRRGRVFNWETATYGKIRVDDDLHDLRSVEAEFPAIVIDNAFAPHDTLPCKSQPRHNNESDLNNETSLSEYDEVEQNVLYFNDLFPFNVIHPDDLKSDEDNDNNEIDIIQSSEGNLNTHRLNMLRETSRDKIDKIFDEESFVLELNVNIVTWIYLFNGMLLCFIINLYVPFGISFDPKWYYKNGDCMLMLRRPRYGSESNLVEGLLVVCSATARVLAFSLLDVKEQLVLTKKTR
ncbi:hypothetical protein Tco_0472913 [Tanacetum coccineum]